MAGHAGITILKGAARRIWGAIQGTNRKGRCGRCGWFGSEINCPKRFVQRSVGAVWGYAGNGWDLFRWKIWEPPAWRGIVGWGPIGGLPGCGRL